MESQRDCTPLMNRQNTNTNNMPFSNLKSDGKSFNSKFTKNFNNKQPSYFDENKVSMKKPIFRA